MTTESRRQNITCLAFSGNVSVQQLKFFTVLIYILENDHKIAQNVDFGVTNKF